MLVVYWTAGVGTRLSEHVATADTAAPSHLPSSALIPLQKVRATRQEAILEGKSCPPVLLLWSRALLLHPLPSLPLLLPA